MERVVYISFDVECAQRFHNYSPICNFGYAIYDENFVLMKIEDIIINPRATFNLTGRKNQEDISMAYPLSTYKRAPEFIKVYKKIKSVLETKNAIIIGQAVRNDIEYLNWEIHKRKRDIKLDAINFKSYDLIDFVKAYEGKSKEPMSLSAIKDRMNLADFIAHKADDDANIVILIIRKMIEDLQVSFKELVELSESLPYESKNGEMIKPYLNKKEKLIAAKNSIQKTEDIASKYSNKNISYSKDYEKSDIVFTIIQRILNINSNPNEKVSETNLFVESSVKDHKDSRKDVALSLEIEIISYEDLMNK